MLGFLKKAWRHWREERRIPARISSQAIALLPLYTWFKVRCIWNTFWPPAAVGCVVAFPIARGRYGTFLLFALQQAYAEVLVVWNPSLRDLQDLFPEGRLIFTMKGIHFMSPRSFDQSHLMLERFDYIRAANGPLPPAGTDRIFDIDIDLARPASPESFLFPYGPHPNHLLRYKSDTKTSSESSGRRRPVRVFFSGTTKLFHDHDYLLVERCFGVPSRATIVAELERSYPDALWLNDPGQRSRLNICGDKQVPVCIATVKGDPRRWLFELRQADFFLCLPGSHMLMCHNAVEAISSGCIPILSYENWFSPNLVHGTNCLSYRDLDGLKRAIKIALDMGDGEIAAMKSEVLKYYEHHLDCERVAKRVFGRDHPYRRLTVYLNQEDCDNYTAAHADSVLYTGGSLQSVLEEGWMSESNVPFGLQR
jgi:hypothetical protein